MSYAVTQRTHEIGIRMAIGAQPSDVFRMILGQGMFLTIVGMVAGLLGAFGLTRLMATMLLSQTDRPVDVWRRGVTVDCRGFRGLLYSGPARHQGRSREFFAL